MSEVRAVPLDECLDALLDYRGKSPPKANQGIPVISAKVVKDGRILRPIQQQISPNFYPVWMTRGYPRQGDVVLTTEGPLGEVAQLDSETCHFALGQRIVVLRGKEKILDNNFLRFLLMSPRQQEILASYATGTTVAGVSQKSLRSMPIQIPCYEDQIAIGGLLVALEDKIELHRRMNMTLQATAWAIFKDWFVDFGPTRAKVEGRAPYLATALWQLFPDRLDDDGKPHTWTEGRLGDIASIAGQVVNPEVLDPATPYIGLEHMPRRSIALDAWAGAGKVTSGKLSFRRGDFLFGKLRPYFHKVGIAPIDGICSTDIVVLRAKQPIASCFVVACISSDEFVAYTDQTSDGTKMPRTSWDLMTRYELVIPPGRLLEKFGSLAAPLFERIISNVHESRALAQLRDLLLPKLMSGDVQIREAERLVKKVS